MSFFALDRALCIGSGTAVFENIPGFFAFEGQYLCVFGNFEKNILKIKQILPFSSSDILNNKWEVQNISSISRSVIRIKDGLKDVMEGNIPDNNGWQRAIKGFKGINHSLASNIIKSVI